MLHMATMNFLQRRKSTRNTGNFLLCSLPRTWDNVFAAQRRLSSQRSLSVKSIMKNEFYKNLNRDILRGLDFFYKTLV